MIAYRAALEVRTRERVQLGWANTQHNLGNVLAKLGRRKGSVEHLNQAVAAYHAALEVRTREMTPLGWAGTQNNLSEVLQALGEQESNTRYLEEAAASLERASEGYQEAQVNGYKDELASRSKEIAALIASRRQA